MESELSGVAVLIGQFWRSRLGSCSECDRDACRDCVRGRGVAIV
jgi:hypothetical protein